MREIKICHTVPAELREKYDLHMTVERFVNDELGDDEKFIRK